MEFLKGVGMSKLIGSLVRHGLTTVAGFFVAWGVMSDTEASRWISDMLPEAIALLTALLTGVGGLVLSIVEKRKAEAKVTRPRKRRRRRHVVKPKNPVTDEDTVL